MTAKNLNKVSVEVNLNGTSCDFSSLELRQSLFGHHLFTIAVNYRAKEADLWKMTAEQVLEQLGNSKEYEMSQFNINFGQSVDHKGQPQDEVRGGRMLVGLTQTLPESMYR